VGNIESSIGYARPMATDFNVKWAPALVILDQEGAAHQQTLGFFPKVPTRKKLPEAVLRNQKPFQNLESRLRARCWPIKKPSLHGSMWAFSPTAHASRR